MQQHNENILEFASCHQSKISIIMVDYRFKNLYFLKTRNSYITTDTIAIALSPSMSFL